VEVVAYQGLDHNGSKFFLIRIWWLPRLNPCANADAIFYLCKSQFWEKNLILPFEKFPFLVLARNTIMLPHLIIHSFLHYLSTCHLREVKNKGKFQTFSYKSGRGCLREVVAYKRFQIQWFDLQTFGILENWLLRRGGCLWDVIATEGSTVCELQKHETWDNDAIFTWSVWSFVQTTRNFVQTCTLKARWPHG